MQVKLNLSQRIASGYLFIILMAVIFGIFTLVKVSENRNKGHEIAEVLTPAINEIKNLQSIIQDSKSNTQLFLLYPSQNQKQALLKIANEKYPSIKNNLEFLLTKKAYGNANGKAEILIFDCDHLFNLQNSFIQNEIIINEENELKKDLLYFKWHAIPNDLSVITKKVDEDLNFILNYQNSVIESKKAELKDSSDFLYHAIIFLLLIITLASIISTLVTTRLIKQPILYLKKTILAMSKGEIPEIYLSKRNDEVGLINNAFVELTESLKRKASFAVETGKGNYNARFTLLSEKDELGISLVEMNKSLWIKAEEVKKENWLKSGIAQMSDILRNEHSNAGVLYSNIISFLARYLVMNQGALFLVKEDREKSKYLEMVAGFACEKNKSLNKRVSFSEGFVGQVATEKKILRFGNIPENYLKINSGLGESIPKNIVVTPLLFENELQGVIELAAFTEINDLQIELLEKLSGIIAATFDLINRKLHTELLLFESQDLNDKLIEREDALKRSNEDLTEKGKQLKISEEELREQQEELMQTNTQLEEKAQLLAEQNEEIRLKNEQLEVAKEAIRLKAEELENTSQYKSEFLANMSHELRTPLNSILILSNLLCENKEKNLNDKQLEYAQVVKRSGSDLLNLINDILDLSKIESRKIELEITEIDLKELGNDIKSLFFEFAKEKKVNFKVNYGKNLPAIIRSDKMRIEQVLKNLLSNAFKFTEKEGTVELNIDKVSKNHFYYNSTVDVSRSMISLQVKDTGIGIPEDKQQLIFEAFKQADGSTSRKYGGTGLGLSISKELSILLGGEIQIESKPGSGSTFTLYLPESLDVNEEQIVHQINQPQDKKNISGLTKSDLLFKSSARSPGIDVSCADRMILIIEDDEDFAKILLAHAAKKGFTGIITNRGDTGLINAKRFKPDAIILDLNLPGMDGWSVMRRIKEDPELQHIPIHIMTGQGNEIKEFPAGAMEILRKPVTSEQLNIIFENLETSLAKRVKKILIIEDNAAQNESIKALLENPDLDCYSALTGKEALQKLASESFDLVTLDLSLPDISGMELLKEIKSLRHCQSIPVIIYTGKNLTIDENRELKRYADSIILKTGRSFERLVDETNMFLNKLDKHFKKDTIQNKINVNINESGTTNETEDEDKFMKGKKVLLVDDDIRNIFAMTSILEHQECIVVIANDGKEALNILANNPDTAIVLMDIMMPEMDGYEAMRLIRSQSAHNAMPIIALTAKAMKGDKEKCMEAGASDYLSKPVDPSKLMSMIKILMYQ